MFDLEGTDNPNEFVECFNLSPTDTVDLARWKIADLWSTDSLKNVGKGTKLAPLSYAVIFEGDHDIANGIYTNLVPDTALVLKVDDNSIGNQLSRQDSVFLIDEKGDTVDRHGWEDILAPGYSRERILLHQPSTASNWAVSFDSLGTPGFVNSRTPLEIDGAVFDETITHDPLFPKPDETISLYLPVYNLGSQAVDGIVRVKESDELLFTGVFKALDEGDSAILDAELSPLPSGDHTFTVSLDVEGDLDLSNNAAEYRVTVSFTGRVLTLNEFHYAPDPDVSEFVELVNTSQEAVNVGGWVISDRDTAVAGLLPEKTIPSGEYVVVSHDSTLLSHIPLGTHLLVPEKGFPSLNNDGDAIYLLEPTGHLMDSLTYTQDWGGAGGRSLEKLNPLLESHVKSNWGTCVAVEKMTPGAQNSIFFEALPSAGSITVQPNPFSPDGDGFDDVIHFGYTLPFEQAYLTILIFDSEGRSVRTLAKNLATGSQGVISWDGLSDRKKRARIGIYIVKIIAADRGSKRSLEWAKTAVLAEPLR